MSTVWAENACPDCKQVPKRDGKGTLKCACPNKNWTGVTGVKATGAIADLLGSKGFTFHTNANGDQYYLGSGGRLLWIFGDGTYGSDPRPAKKSATLEEYLEEHLAPFF